MNRCCWSGIDRRGQRVHGCCAADHPTALEEALAERGIALLRRYPPPRRCGLHSPGERSRLATLRRLARLLEAGAPLSEALRALAAQSRHARERLQLRHVRHQVERGTPLPEAFAAAWPDFDPVHRALLEAGTWTGDLPGALARIADEQERRLQLRRSIRQACAYPAVVGAAALALMAMLLLVLVPRFEAVIGTAPEDLPALTRAVLATSEAITTLLPMATAIALAAIAGVMALRRSPPWRRTLRRLTDRLPWLGTTRYHADLARWCGTLAELLRAGVPLLQALPLAERAAAGGSLERPLQALQRRVRAGEPFAGALRRALPAATEAVQLAGVGEASGRLDEALAEAAEGYKQALEDRLKRLATVLEPLLIVLMGVITALVVAALYLPVFQIGGPIQ